MVRRASPNLLRTDTSQVDDALLSEIVRRIRAAGNPRSIILFGSHARGDADLSSDLDLLIIEDASKLPMHRRATPYRMALTGLHPRKDIIVCTADEVEHWHATAGAFVTTAIREGRSLYERSN